VIDRRCDAVRAATDGWPMVRVLNRTLLAAAITCGGYAATGEIDLQDALEALLKGAVAAGHPERSARATIESGFRYGLMRPLQRPPSWRERILSARSDGEVDAIVRELDHGH
jgi:hypothetical protein